MPTPPDRLFSAAIRINGSEDADLYDCVENITVDEDLERGSSFTLTLSLLRNEDGSWPHLDGESFRPWNRITLIAAFPDHSDTIMDGYISHVHPSADPANGVLSVRLQGVDASYEMNLEEKAVVWTRESLGDEPTYEKIAREIINSYGFRPVPETLGEESAGGEAPAVVQRGTDHRFLRELARRKGYEFFLHGADAHFHPPDLSGPPQKLIAFNFGDETNCEDLQVTVDGTRPTEATMTRFDPLEGVSQTVTATSSGLESLGTSDLSTLRGAAAVPQTRVIVRREVASSEAQMRDFVEGVLRRHGWWVTARGTLNGLCYGRVLRSKKLVTIKGMGSSYNGNYYVRKVRHELGPRQYSMSFEAHRNALGQLGSEDFSGERPDAIGAPVALGAGADSDVVRVRDSGARVAPA